MNPERFSTGWVLPFTHKRTNPKWKHSGLVLFPEILNPESKVETSSAKTFESGEFCRYKRFSLESGYFFRQRYFEFAVELNSGSSNPKESKVIGVFRMAIDGGRWKPPRSVTGLGSLLICASIPEKQKRATQTMLTSTTLYRKWQWHDRKSG